jgi:hypothetical protein
LARLASKADLWAEAFDDVRLTGQLRLGLPNDADRLAAVHRLDEILVPLGQGGVREPIGLSTATLATLTDGGELYVDEHAFPVLLGATVDIVIAHLLSDLPTAPRHVAGLVHGAFDCALLDRHAGWCGDGRLEHCVCELASELDMTDVSTRALWAYPTVHVGLAARMIDGNGDYVREGLDEGILLLRWTGVGTSDGLACIGEADGALVDAPSAPLAEIRTNIHRVICAPRGAGPPAPPRVAHARRGCVSRRGGGHVGCTPRRRDELRRLRPTGARTHRSRDS